MQAARADYVERHGDHINLFALWTRHDLNNSIVHAGSEGRLGGWNGRSDLSLFTLWTFRGLSIIIVNTDSETGL